MPSSSSSLSPPPQAAAAAPAAGNGNGNARAGVAPIKPPFLLTMANNFLHLPYVYDLSWYAIWGGYLLMLPLLNIAGLWAMFVYELCSGKLCTSQRFAGPEGRAIVITGCDSGFGYDAAVELALNRGFTVYAGCLTEAGVAALGRLASEKKGRRVGKLIPLRLDVTKGEDMDACFERVARECDGRLFACVNNAGVGLSGMVDWMPEEHFQLVMDVNFFSVVKMCKRAIPFLQRQVLYERSLAAGGASKEPLHPRIVNLTSFAGLYYGQACMAAYSASKHAAEAFSDSLRTEMAFGDIDICVLNPTFHATGMVADAVVVTEKAFRAISPEKQAAYGEAFFQEAVRVTAETTQGAPWDPANVCSYIAHAATAQRPRRQYILGMDGRFLLAPLLMLPESLAAKLAYWSSKSWRLRPAWLLESDSAASKPAAAPASPQQEGVVISNEEETTTESVSD